MIDASPEFVACQWRHWEIFDTLLGRPYQVEPRDAETERWRGHYWKIAATGELLQHRWDVESGSFAYRAVGRMFGFTGVAACVLEYHLTADGKTAVQGWIDVDLAGWLTPFSFIIRGVIESGLDQFLDNGQRTSELLQHDYERAVAVLSAAQREAVEEYLRIARDQRVRRRAREARGRMSDAVLEISDEGTSVAVTYGRRSNTQRATVTGKIRPAAVAAMLTTAEQASSLLASVPGNARGMSEPGTDVSLYQKMTRIGQDLYVAIPGDIRARLEALGEQGDDVLLGVRATGRLSAIPWELVRTDQDFLCLQLPCLRSSGLPVREVPAMEQISALLVGSDARGDLRFVANELDTAALAIMAARGKVDRIGSTMDEDAPEATRHEVLSRLASGKYNILHYAGHSVFDEREGLAYLELADGPLHAHDIGRDARNLAMVFLNSCTSASPIGKTVQSVGVADAIARAGVPFVVAMVCPVSDRGGRDLADEFYRQLADGRHPAAALRAARLAVIREEDWHDPTWLAPVLYA